MESRISLCRRCGSDEAAYDELIQGVMPVILQVNNGITKITQGNLRNERSRPILPQSVYALTISQRGGDSNTFPHGTDKALRRKSGIVYSKAGRHNRNDVAQSASYLVQDCQFKGVSTS